MKITSIHVLVAITVIILAAGAWVWIFVEPPDEVPQCGCSTSVVLLGTLFVSDSGAPLANFTTAIYNASLLAVNGTGALQLTYDSGTDVITEKSHAVTCLCPTDDAYSVQLEEQDLVISLDLEDRVWNGTYAGYYIASNGPNAQPEAVRGHIDPGSFPGLDATYYVELRLK